MLQDQLLRTVLKLLAPCIVNAKMEAITSNYRLRLASTDVNPATLDKFTFETLDRIQQTSAPFLSFLLKIATGAGDRRTIWGKTPADLECNARSSSKSLSEYNSGVDLENRCNVMVTRPTNHMILTHDHSHDLLT